MNVTMSSGAFSRHQFSADYTISMFEFDFRQGQPGNASCRRMNHDNTRATNPMLIAVIEYWMAMTLASWQETYFVTKLFGW